MDPEAHERNQRTIRRRHLCDMLDDCASIDGLDAHDKAAVQLLAVAIANFRSEDACKVLAPLT
jgi:hypothetical protein